MRSLVPVDSRLWDRLIGSGLILTPHLDSYQFSDEVGQFNQPFFLFGLRVMDGNHSRFALA